MTARRRIQVLTLLLLPCAAATGYPGPPVSADNPPPAQRAVTAQPMVLLTRAVETELTDPIRGTGVVVADKTTDLGPAIDGILEQVLVEVGDRVRRGQPLARLRSVDYRLRVERETASVSLAEAELEQRALDLARNEELRRQNVVSEDRLDAASTAHRIAAAKLDQAKAELAKAEQDLRDTTLRAPYDGVITRRAADEGALVRAMPGAGGAILQIQKVDLVIAVVHVPEVVLPRIALGMPAKVSIDSIGREYSTTVGIVNDLVEESSHAVELRLPLPNPDLAIKPGLFVEVELETPGRRTLLLARSAVQGSVEAAWVWTVDGGGRARRRSVRIRELDAGRVEVLDGLDAGEWVVIDTGGQPIEEGTVLRGAAAEDAGASR